MPAEPVLSVEFQQAMVEVRASVAVAEFALLEVQVERAGVHAAEPSPAVTD